MEEEEEEEEEEGVGSLWGESHVGMRSFAADPTRFERAGAGAREEAVTAEAAAAVVAAVVVEEAEGKPVSGMVETAARAAPEAEARALIKGDVGLAIPEVGMEGSLDAILFSRTGCCCKLFSPLAAFAEASAWRRGAVLVLA